MVVAAGLRVGRYEVLGKLGQGGFGVLYVGRDLELDREVALKFLRPEHLTREDVVQRFLQEARSAAKINHPGIVTVFECGQVTGTNTRADGTVYIAMELLAGESLAQRLKRDRLMPLPMVLGITRQLCGALQAAHLAGIVHRDLKPDNVFLVPDSALRDGLRVKILDFGVAKLADGQFSGGVRTHSAMVLGTPTYMSPEQCKSSAKVDHRSDIYAVGCIFYELLCGARPYDGDAGEQIAKHQLAPVPIPRAVNPNVPLELDRLVTRMLAKAPDDRPESMEHVEQAIAAFERNPTSPAPGASGLDDTMLATVPRAKTPPPIKDAPPSGTAMTVFEGEHARTRSASGRGSRVPLVAGTAGVIVLGILIGVVVTHGGGDKTEPPAPPAVAKAGEPPVARDAAVAPPPDAQVVVAVEPPPIDAAAAPEPNSDDVKMECLKLAADKKWNDLLTCSDRLASGDPTTSNDLRVKAVMENKAESALRNVADALRRGDRQRAKAELDRIPTDSVYRADALAAYMAAATNITTTVKQTAPTAVACDADALRERAEEHLQTGMDAAALAGFEASMRCKPDAALLRFALMAACRSKNAAKAKYYFPKVPAATTTGIIQICIRNGITVP